MLWYCLERESVCVKYQSSLLCSTKHTQGSPLHFFLKKLIWGEMKSESGCLHFYAVSIWWVCKYPVKRSACDSIPIALGHQTHMPCNSLTYMNGGVVLILSKAIVCAAVDTPSIV